MFIKQRSPWPSWMPAGKLVMESIPETEASAPLQVLGWRTAMVRPSGFIGRFRRRHELASRRAATRSGSKICPDATVPHKSITSRHICPNFIWWPSPRGIIAWNVSSERISRRCLAEELRTITGHNLPRPGCSAGITHGDFRLVISCRQEPYEVSKRWRRTGSSRTTARRQYNGSPGSAAV